MLYDIQDDRPSERHVNVVPRHPSTVKHRKSVARVIGHVLEIHDPRVVVILTREYGAEKFGGMNVRERVTVCVPTTEAEIETTYARVVVVDNNNLFVVGPEFDAI